MAIRRWLSVLDDRVWWHRLRLHRVRSEVQTVDPQWRFWAYVCETCDVTWVR